MAITVLADVFVPQVVGDKVTDILFRETPLLRTGVVKPIRPKSYDAAGNTVTFQVWNTDTSGIVQNQVKNSRTGVTPSKLSATSYTETLLDKIVSLEADEDVFTDSEGVNEHIAEVVSNEMMGEVQATLIARGAATALSLDISAGSGAAAKLSVDAIAEAKAKRGEHAGKGMPILFVNSKQFTDLQKTSDFKSLGSAATNSIVQAGGLPPGTVAVVWGVAIVLLDAIAADGSSNYTSLMCWPGSLGLWVKKEVTHKGPINHAGSNVVTHDFSARWGATLIRQNPRGVVKLITK